MTIAPTVSLRELTDDEFAGFLDRTVATFAAAIGPARDLTPDAATAEAQRDTDRLLPDGRRTAGHLFWIALDGTTPIGNLWIKLEPKPFVYGVEVDEAQRGKGYGRAIMLAGEEECRQRGHHTLDLNVFGDNTPAINLYTSLGYTVLSQQMRKIL